MLLQTESPNCIPVPGIKPTKSESVPDDNLSDAIVHPPIAPAFAVILPDIVMLPWGVKWKFDEDISITPADADMNCDAGCPT